MRLQIVSDLHLSHWSQAMRLPKAEVLPLLVPETDADAIIVAGDIDDGGQGVMCSTLAQIRPSQPVLYVLGNHDFYGGRMPSETEDSLYCIVGLAGKISCGQSGLRFGERFVGTTLWHDDTEIARYLAPDWSDSCIIGWREEVGEANRRAQRLLAEELTPGAVLITHFLPTRASIAPKYKGYPTNCFFVSDLEELIAARKPALVIHGHTHTAQDYTLPCGVRVVCNPVGYPGENYNHRSTNPEHWPPRPMIVEVGP